jgi:osmotically-inducible protein OsmY
MKKENVYSILIATVVSIFIAGVMVTASDRDDRIVSSAKQSYVFKTVLKDDDVKIQCINGQVTLTGMVAQESDKTLAGETAGGLPEVTSVINELKVKYVAASVYSNAWLITRVKSKLLFHRNVNATGTKILATDGVVTLRGVAANRAQKDLTTEYAKDVEGVKEVKNEMAVFTDIVKPMDKSAKQKLDAVTESVDDASITAMTRTVFLTHRSVSALKTDIKTKSGVVTLAGNAKNAAEKSLAGKLAGDVYGVKGVVNNMTVK